MYVSSVSLLYLLQLKRNEHTRNVKIKLRAGFERLKAGLAVHTETTLLALPTPLLYTYDARKNVQSLHPLF